MAREAKNPVQTVEKAFDIVETLSEQGSMGVTALATHLDMSKSIVHNHLRTLEERGYVTYVDDEYDVSLRFLRLGGKRRSQMPLYQVATDEVKELAERCETQVNLGVEENGQCLYLYSFQGGGPMDLRFSYEGMYEQMHHTAIGKAILAYLPDERVDEILAEHEMIERTEKTITDREALFSRLETVREQGYAVDDEESIRGLRCIAAPILDPEGAIAGSISVAGPRSKFKGERWSDELPEIVRDSSNMIELQLVEIAG